MIKVSIKNVLTDLYPEYFQLVEYFGLVCLDKILNFYIKCLRELILRGDATTNLFCVKVKYTVINIEKILKVDKHRINYRIITTSGN